MGKSVAQLAVNELVDAVFVLSVKTFADRISHIKNELGRANIEFEFIFDHDAAELDQELLHKTFIADVLPPRQQSLVLKHIQAWRIALSKGYNNILVFEDDVLLSKRFVSVFNQAIVASRSISPGWLIYLGGADTKAPDHYFTGRGVLAQLAIATTEAYVTDREAIKRRLDWVAANKIDSPSDHLLKKLDPDLGIVQYWTRPPLVEQGSVTGLFDSSLDQQRLKHSKIFNILRNKWMKFYRHQLRAWSARMRAWRHSLGKR